MRRCHAASSALVTLVLACTPTPPAGTATEAATTSTTADASSATEGMTSTSGASTSTTTNSTTEATTNSTTEATTSATTDDSTTGVVGCGDGVAEPGQVCFERIEIDTYALGDIIPGDLDEDGHLDLFLVNYFPCPSVDPDRPLSERPTGPGTPRDGGAIASFTRAFGDGAGGFVINEGPAVELGNTNDATLRDFNGDGHLDLAVGDILFDGGMTFAVSVLLGDGLGGFGEPLHSAVPIPAFELEPGDVDGDGDLDLVIASPSGLVALQNDGAGTFTALDPFADTTHRDPNLHDLDGDGHLDLAVLRGPAPALEVHRGAGDGTFALDAVLAMDVDSFLDLALLAPANATRPAILFTSNTHLMSIDVEAGGDFAPPAVLGDKSGWRILLGNFDGGPRPDALVMEPGIRALVGADPWPSPLVFVGSNGDSLSNLAAVGDFNEDGVDDVAYAAGSLVLLLSDP